MKKRYIPPEVEVIEFEDIDIICFSGFDWVELDDDEETSTQATSSTNIEWVQPD